MLALHFHVLSWYAAFVPAARFRTSQGCWKPSPCATTHVLFFCIHPDEVFCGRNVAADPPAPHVFAGPVVTWKACYRQHQVNGRAGPAPKSKAVLNLSWLGSLPFSGWGMRGERASPQPGILRSEGKCWVPGAPGLASWMGVDVRIWLMRLSFRDQVLFVDDIHECR